MMNVKVNRLDCSGCSQDLRVYLKNLSFTVWYTTREAVEAAGNKKMFMAAVKDRNIIFVADDIKSANFTMPELESIIWHEIGHIVMNTDDEKKADAFSINKVGLKTWRSAMVKSWMVACEYSPSRKWSFSEKYDHRRKFVVEFLKEHNLRVPEWL